MQIISTRKNKIEKVIREACKIYKIPLATYNKKAEVAISDAMFSVYDQGYYYNVKLKKHECALITWISGKWWAANRYKLWAFGIIPKTLTTELTLRMFHQDKDMEPVEALLRVFRNADKYL